MATLIEVLAISHKEATLALYYTIDTPIAAAADPARSPAGTRLSPTEQQELKDGLLHELVRIISLYGLNKLQAKAKIEAEWADRETEAEQEYKKIHRDQAYVGKKWDGTSWS